LQEVTGELVCARNGGLNFLEKITDYFKGHLEEDLRPESSFPLSGSECKNNCKLITIEEIFAFTVDFSIFILLLGINLGHTCMYVFFPCALSFYIWDFNKHVIYNYI